MGKCINHPDRETSYLCMKHNIYMCEECIRCRDPEIYCVFRPSCPIWFLGKRINAWEKLDSKKSAGQPAEKYRVIFNPDQKEISVAKGTTLLEASRLAEVHLNASCNGNGSCGKCKLIIDSGKVDTQSTSLLSEEEKKQNYILACMSKVIEDVSLSIPKESLEKKLKVAGLGKEATDHLRGLVEKMTPLLEEIELELDPPSLDDPISDLDRLNRGLKKAGIDINNLNIGLKVCRDLSAALREDNWKVTASIIRKKCSNEILHVAPKSVREEALGLAIDIGTTSIVVYLVAISDGTVLAATSGHNRQADCGDDVINRIVCAEKDGVVKLSKMAMVTINDLIGEALASARMDYRQIKNIVISGNTTMVHLLLKIEPRHIRREPYVPTVSEFPILKASEIGIKASPYASVFIMPGPAGYVGGDIVSGLVYTGLHRETPVTLFIDIGTNGEIVLGNSDWLMTASCSAGPAFEGGGIRWGMRAEEGAIEKIKIDPDTLIPEFTTVENIKPRGICGSGMIDLISEMLLKGVIAPNGKFILDTTHDRMAVYDDELAYIIARAEETSVDRDIIFTEMDINSLVLSKGAVYAGFTVLLKQAGMDFNSVDRVWITGGFGQYLNIEKAITIGLLPDIARDKFKYFGNSSIAGAYMALLSDEYRKEAREISNSMTYIDFSSNSQFMDEYTSAQFLPHTDGNAFPSVKILK